MFPQRDIGAGFVFGLVNGRLTLAALPGHQCLGPVDAIAVFVQQVHIDIMIAMIFDG